jgi:hypothetical protein
MFFGGNIHTPEAQAKEHFFASLALQAYWGLPEDLATLSEP